MSFLFTPVLFPLYFLLSPLPTLFQGKGKKKEKERKGFKKKANIQTLHQDPKPHPIQTHHLRSPNLVRLR